MTFGSKQKFRNWVFIEFLQILWNYSPTLRVFRSGTRLTVYRALDIGLNQPLSTSVWFVFLHTLEMQLAVHSLSLLGPMRTKGHRQNGPSRMTWNLKSSVCFLFSPLFLWFVSVSSLCDFCFLCLFLLVPKYFKLNFVLEFLWQ